MLRIYYIYEAVKGIRDNSNLQEHSVITKQFPHDFNDRARRLVRLLNAQKPLRRELLYMETAFDIHTN
jgi:hypothetical protein